MDRNLRPPRADQEPSHDVAFASRSDGMRGVLAWKAFELPVALISELFEPQAELVEALGP
jgi:hypothetical protein